MFFHPYMCLEFKTSVALTKVKFELCLGQSVVDYICISNLPMNIYYFSEPWPIKFNSSSLALVDPFSTPIY